MSETGYEIINRDIIYNGPVNFRLDTFNYNGKTFRKEVVEHNPSVGIIPLINDKEILLIKQFRHAVNKVLIEIPAGKIEENELPIEAANRELAEETGYKGHLRFITNCFLAPSYDTEMMYLYVAENIHRTDQTEKMDDDENISSMIVKLDDAIKYCHNGAIIDCKTISAILLYYNSLKHNDN